MKKFTKLDALVVPLDRANVDTDAIIPKQFLKSIKRSGFGPNAFDEWRYLDHGEPDMDNSKRPLNPDFVLNKPRYQGAEILLARENFGCGSSREAAVWALRDYGIRCVVAPSFGDIFYGNCFENGMLPLRLHAAALEQLAGEARTAAGEFTVDLVAQRVTGSGGRSFAFDIDPRRRAALLQGLDAIGATLAHADAIAAFQARDRARRPWIYRAIN